MKTPMQELIEEIDLTVHPKSWKEVFKAIEDKYIEKEKQVIIDAFYSGEINNGNTKEFECSTQYYSETFKQ